MKKSNLTIGSFMVSGLLFLSAPLALADSFTGKLNGHGCAHHGSSCPTDRLDPHLALEPDFVLQVSGGDYYFLSNVPRNVKVRHVLQQIEVDGDLNEKYRTIKVNDLRVGGKSVWSLEAQKKEREYLYNEGWFFIN